MTELVACPRCGDALDVPVELLGKPVRCAACRTVFTPQPAEAVPTAPRATRAWAPPRRPTLDDAPAPKSNAWVWLVLVLLVGLFGGLVLLCGGWVRTVVNPPMTEHASDAGRFRVALPAEPTAVSRPDDKAAPAVGLLAMRAENQDTFQVLSAELPAAARKLDLEKEEAATTLLGDLAKQYLPALGAGTEVQRETTWHGKYRALDALFEQGGGLFRRVTVARLVVAHGRVYVLSAQGANLEPNIWYVRRFFTSFEPLPAK